MTKDNVASRESRARPVAAVALAPHASHEPRATSQAVQPWYREPWPWILMSGPAAVVVAGAITIWIAFATSDGLVADDYYKRGLAINQELRRDDLARELGITAELEARDGVLRLRLTAPRGAPEAVFVRLVHPTRAGLDQRLRLAPVGPGIYEAVLGPLTSGRWRVVLEDPRGSWRIVKEGL